MTPGETRLDALLAGLRPALHPGIFVFCTGPHDRELPPDALMTFREEEAVTVIVRRDTAEACGLPFAFPCAWITLTVQSSLNAVGLTAAVSSRLAECGIACNIVAAFYHDHLFVPIDRAADALDVLNAFGQDSV